MAAKRMFLLNIINSDAFVDMSLSARGLYFHLAMEADDEGFLSSALRITRSVGGTKELLDELVDSGYLIRFDSGIYLIRDWFQHNTIKPDRGSKTIHEAEKEQVKLIKKVYYRIDDPKCLQNGSSLETQYSLDKNSKDKDSEVESSEDESPPSFIKPTINELRDYANSIGYFNFNPEVFMAYYSEHDWIDPHTHKPIDWKNRIDLWKARERTSSGSSKPSKNPFNNFEQHDYDFDALEKSLLAN